MARPQYNIIFMRRFHCQLNSALRQPSPAPPANRLVYTSNNAGDWPTKAVSNNNRFAKSFLDRCNDIAFLADLMGHESIETTRIYLRKTATEQREIVDTIVDW